MLKLYLVIYISGMVGGYSDPIPENSMAICEALKAQFLAGLDPNGRTRNGFTAKDVTAECKKLPLPPSVQIHD